MAERATHDLRPDIQAMRAIAVASVFVYHLIPRLAPGGFTGVDVFFVISGFLITGNLVREAERTGRIDVWSFWSRRARRLLPAALLVIGLSVLGVVVLVPSSLWQQFLGECLAATFYVENWALAAASTDYLAANNVASPVQHYWTLSAEEQFYIFTPLLLLAILALARRVHIRDTRRAMLAGIAAVGAGSLAYSVYLTAVAAPAAYFVTTTRAWEFCVGAGVLFLPRPRSKPVALAAVGLGLLGVVTAVFGISAADPFPGAIAAWPVAGAALLIWGGLEAGERWSRLTALRPFQFLGGVSYSVYLWHWPLIILVPYALGQPLTRTTDVLVVGATLVVAWASTRFVEDPVRYSPRLLGRRRPRVILGWAAAGMVLVALVAASTLVVFSQRQAVLASQDNALATTDAACLGARALGGSPCPQPLPSGFLVPNPASAAEDTQNRTDCWATVDSATLSVCTLGPADAPVRLAAIGDSHNNQYLAAYELIAQQHGWRIDVAGHNGCGWTGAVQVNPVRAQQDACEAWKRAVDAWLAGGTPYTAIIVTEAHRGAPVIAAPGLSVAETTVKGLLDAWRPVMARGTRIIAISDNPAMDTNITACVTRYGADANRYCSSPAASALARPDPLAVAASQAGDATVIDLSAIFCPGGTCLPVIGHVVVYSDTNHLTATFVRSLAPTLGERIAAALPPSAPAAPSPSGP